MRTRKGHAQHCATMTRTRPQSPFFSPEGNPAHMNPPSVPPAPHLMDMPIPDTSCKWNHTTHRCLRLCSLSTMFPRGLASSPRGRTRPPGHTSTEPAWLPTRGCPRRPIRTAPRSIQLERLSSALLGRCPRVELLGPQATYTELLEDSPSCAPPSCATSPSRQRGTGLSLLPCSPTVFLGKSPSGAWEAASHRGFAPCLPGDG